MMELFAKIVKGYRQQAIFHRKSAIIDGRLDSSYASVGLYKISESR